MSSDFWVQQLNQSLFCLGQLGQLKGVFRCWGCICKLSNLDFWAGLHTGREDNNLWLTTKRVPVCTDHLARAAFRFWCVPLSLWGCWQELVFVVWFCQLTRWVHDAQSVSTPMQNIQFIMSEVCYLNGESGLLSRMSVSSPTFSSFFCGYVQSTDVTWFKICTKSFTVGGFPSILNIIAVTELKLPTTCPTWSQSLLRKLP